MAFITIKLDDSLKNDAALILDEIGLDIPTAVRMYLKAIVRENGLPIRTKLGAAKPETPADPCSSLEEKPEAEEAPATEPVKTASVQDFIDLICSVPVGAVTRWRDMEAALSAKYGAEVKAPAVAEWPKNNADGLAIPYWRVLTDRGAIRADAACSKELREDMLKAEGHEFVTAGHGTFSGIKVAGYRQKFVKF